MLNQAAVRGSGGLVRSLVGTLWVVAVCAALLLAWHSGGQIDCGTRNLPCAMVAAGVAGMLLTVVLLVLHRWPFAGSPAVMILVGLCVGAGVACLAYVLMAVGLRDPEGVGVDPITTISAVLAVVLAVTTFILQKTAADAQSEARRALARINEGRRVMATATRLLSISQRCSVGAADFSQRTANPVDRNPAVFQRDLAAAEVLSRSARFLMELHLMLVEGMASDEDDKIAVASGLRLDSEDIIHKAVALRLDLKTLDRALPATLAEADTHRRQLRREFFLPTARLLERLTIAPDGWAGQPPTGVSAALLDHLRRVRRDLEEF